MSSGNRSGAPRRTLRCSGPPGHTPRCRVFGEALRCAEAHFATPTGARPRTTGPAVGVLRATLAAAVLLAACGDEPREPRLLQREDRLATSEPWRDAYREVTGHPALDRARAVFEGIRHAAGQNAELLLLEVARGPLALALADDTIVLSREALDRCYRTGEGAAGDARLAFVLGHELAHLANGDFWHASAFTTVRSARNPSAELRALQELLAQDATDRQVLELKADDAGILATILAGYDPEPLLSGSRTFFEEWVGGPAGQVVYADPDHPGTAQRAEFLRVRLERVAGEVETFHRGVAAFRRAEALAREAPGKDAPGRAVLPEVADAYAEAAARFEEVRRIFPGREVLSNLALARLRLAAAALAACDGTLVRRYYLPAALDPVTLAERARLRGEGSHHSSPCFEHPEYRENVDEAVRLLDEAVRRDPAYLPARLHLVAALVLDERGAGAVVAAEEAVARGPEDPNALAARAAAYLAYADQGSAFIDDDAVLEELAGLHRRFPEHPAIAYDLAAALARRGRPEKAAPVWRAFLRAEPAGPWAEIAREWLGATGQSAAP
ncbi:MAG: hypothetical protein ACLF0P_04910 [Thermoanaerobaculia bacterium]